ncbi:MAG: glycosyltransferase [Chloroflexi bacterium]|uniref:glycosyltransferase n=1 Tax=Candidatus Flexifilum breve TaxID=3140694 RepID=UPI003134EB82|nr:glycosyltransferase [Chloroflexota bacterium]
MSPHWPLHVLFLPSWYPSPEMPVNGIFTQVQAQVLQNAGVQVGIVFPELNYWRRFSLRVLFDGLRRTGFHDEGGIRAYRLHAWYMVWFQRWLGTQAYVFGTKQYIERPSRPDLIHVHVADFAGFAALRLWETERIPYVITEHSSAYLENLYSLEQLRKLRPIFRSAQHVIAVSQAAAQSLLDSDMCDQSKLSVISNVIDTNFFSPNTTSKKDDGKFRFLTIGLMAAVKRFDWVLGSFAAAFGNLTDVILEVGGDGELRPQLEQLVHEYGIEAQVSFLGQLDREGVRSALRRADTFILGSQFETFGIVLIEALACGVPVVSTACGGPNEIVTPETGLLVPVDDQVGFANALQTMRTSAHNYDPMALHQYVVERYSAHKVSADLIALYNSIL